MCAKKHTHAILILLFASLSFSGCNFPEVSPRSTLTSSPTKPVETHTPAAPSPTYGASTPAKPTLTQVPPVATKPPISSPVPAATPVTGEIQILQISMTDASSGWSLAAAPGINDQLLHTTDGGQTWSSQTPPEPLPASVDITKKASGAFTDSDTAWLIYQNDPAFAIPDVLNVWHTQDRGKTWQASLPLALPGPPDFLNITDFQITPSGVGFFLAHIGAGMNHDYVAIFRSDPSSVSWERVADPFDNPDIQGCQKTGLDFIDGMLGWMTVDCQGVRDIPYYFVSTNGGQAWEMVELSPPTDEPDLFSRDFCGVYAPQLFDDRTGLLVLRCLSRADFTSQENFLYRLDGQDGGWVTTVFPGGDLLFLDKTRGFALSREIWWTEDQGANWELVKLVNWDGRFSFIDSQNGWAVARAGESSALVRTTDGGQTWQEIFPVMK